jgi:hypothetical protein
MTDEVTHKVDVGKLPVSRGSRFGSSHRERAAQLRTRAETETDDRVRRELLRLANQYEGLAAVLG